MHPGQRCRLRQEEATRTGTPPTVPFFKIDGAERPAINAAKKAAV